MPKIFAPRIVVDYQPAIGVLQEHVNSLLVQNHNQNLRVAFLENAIRNLADLRTTQHSINLGVFQRSHLNFSLSSVAYGNWQAAVAATRALVGL